jgi:hypothetical protein
MLDPKHDCKMMKWERDNQNRGGTTMKHISQEAYEQFETDYPAAAAFLLHHSLRGELGHLLSQEHFDLLSDWQKNRLEELKKLSELWEG